MTDIKSALDAAGTAADYSAHATYQRGYEAGNEGTRALMAQMDSLVVQRDAAEALARSNARTCERATYLYRDAAARASNAEALIHDLRRDEVAFADGLTEARAALDAAQQMVAEMRAVLADIARGDYSDPCCMKTPEQRARDALAASAPIAGRWCLASERDEAVRIADLAGTRYIEAVAKIAEAEAKAETNHRREVAAHKAGVEAEHIANSLLAETYDYVGTKKLGDMGPRIRAHLDAAPAGVAAPRRGDMLAEALHKMRVDLDAAERRESELGLQVVAQAARLRLATVVCDALRRAEARAAEGYDGFPDYYDAVAALAAWDAVPGDNR